MGNTCSQCCEKLLPGGDKPKPSDEEPPEVIPGEEGESDVEVDGVRAYRWNVCLTVLLHAMAVILYNDPRCNGCLTYLLHAMAVILQVIATTVDTNVFPVVAHN